MDFTNDCEKFWILFFASPAKANGNEILNEFHCRQVSPGKYLKTAIIPSNPSNKQPLPAFARHG